MEFSCVLIFRTSSCLDDSKCSLFIVKVKCAFMSNNEQNGRPDSSEETSPPRDPRSKNSRTAPPTSEARKICRDFVWGICSMNNHCKYRHELEYESMKSILKFCHDYQNRLGCTRPECSYLHASREEENLFLTSGVIPRALVERYASMSNQNQAEQVLEPIPPQMMYIREYGVHPPPPPPLNAQNSHPAPVALPGPVMGPNMLPQPIGPVHPAPISNNLMPPPVANQQAEQPSHPHAPITVKTNLHAVPIMASTVAAPMPPILAPPPPPPPTITTTASQTSSPVYTVAQPLQYSKPSTYPVASSSTTYPAPSCSTQQQARPSTSTQLSLPPLFDPSRPPPPVPTKRPTSNDSEAGPSKSSKLENEPGTNENRCESCIALNLRIAIEQQEIEKLQREEEKKRRLYEQKVEEYENANLLLKSLLGPHIFRMVEEFIEMGTPPPNEPSSSSPSSSSAQNIPRQFLFQLMEFLLNKCYAEQRAPQVEMRRPSSSQTDMMIASIMRALQNGTSAEARMPPLDGVGGNNGLSRLTNGPLEPIASTSRYQPTSPRYQSPPNAPPVQPPPYVPNNEEAAPTVAPYRPEPPPPPLHVPYQVSAAAPPPPRPHYPLYPGGGPVFAPTGAPPTPAPGVPPPVVSAPPPPHPPQQQPPPPPPHPYQYNSRMPHNYHPPYQ